MKCKKTIFVLQWYSVKSFSQVCECIKILNVRLSGLHPYFDSAKQFQMVIATSIISGYYQSHLAKTKNSYGNTGWLLALTRVAMYEYYINQEVFVIQSID